MQSLDINNKKYYIGVESAIPYFAIPFVWLVQIDAVKPAFVFFLYQKRHCFVYLRWHGHPRSTDKQANWSTCLKKLVHKIKTCTYTSSHQHHTKDILIVPHDGYFDPNRLINNWVNDNQNHLQIILNPLNFSFARCCAYVPHWLIAAYPHVLGLSW